MKSLLLVLLLVSQVNPGTGIEMEPNPDSDKAGCGLFVKWTAQVVDELDPSRVELVTFWDGPFSGVSAVRTTTQNVANLGAWGTYKVGGYHNSAYVHEYFPPQRIVRTRYEHDCGR